MTVSVGSAGSDAREYHPSHLGERRSVDRFDATSWKLGLLFDIHEEHRVLMLGAGAPAEEAQDFGLSPRADHVRDISAARALARTYDLVVWSPSTRDFVGEAAAIAQILSTGGRVLALCRHRWSLHRGKASLRAMLDTTLHSLRKYQQLLRSADLLPDSCWLPWPTLPSAEEYLSVGDLEEISRSTGARTTLAARFRLATHDGYAILAQRLGAHEAPSSERGIPRAVASLLGLADVPIVTRFDLRQRGALVVMLRTPSIGAGLVARLGHHAHTQRQLEDHGTRLESIRTAAAAHPSLLKYLPKPLGRAPVGNSMMWLEERLPGTVAWRLPAPLRDVLDGDWMKFLGDMGRVRSEQVQISDNLLRRWGVDVHSFSSDMALDLAPLVSWLAARWSRRSVQVGWAHGDFGYGNLLADPHNGHLEAVIDWETADPDEVIGVDWMNMLLAREKVRTGCDLGEAVRRVGARFRSEAQRDDAADALLKSMHEMQQQCEPLELLALALLRVVQREFRYAELFRSALPEFRHAIGTFRAVANF